MGPLAHLQETLSRHVADDSPRVVALVAGRDEAEVMALGLQDVDRREPMRRDTIFRLSSMTKPMTAVAALILIEQGRFHLDDPVDHFLPELANRKVLKRIDGPLDDTVPASRPITVRDLLTFRMGFGMLMAPPDAFPILTAANELNLGLAPPNPAHAPAPDEWLRRLGTLPLMRHPGDTWLYHTGSAVLGVLIARASGRPFEAVLREHLFEPLGMKDTAFHVPAEKQARFATAYCVNPDSGRRDTYDAPREGQWSRPPAFQSGADGLVSTVDDYGAFARMLLEGGAVGRTRILARSSVDAMTTNQLTLQQQADGAAFLDDRGWGYGVAVATHARGAVLPGQYGWDGGLGTSWCSDPARSVLGVLLTQRMQMSPTPPALPVEFWRDAQRAFT